MSMSCFLENNRPEVPSKETYFRVVASNSSKIVLLALCFLFMEDMLGDYDSAFSIGKGFEEIVIVYQAGLQLIKKVFAKG